MSAQTKILATDAVEHAVHYLRSCGIHVPKFNLTTDWHPWKPGNSYVLTERKNVSLNMGRYRGTFLRNWFAMHELGHVLWDHHRPDRSKPFRAEFGEQRPEDYLQIHARESWKTVMSHLASWNSGLPRPPGEPSWYGAKGGGDERFCELIALMYAHGDFSKDPPPDLSGLWEVCWKYGLSRMT